MTIPGSVGLSGDIYFHSETFYPFNLKAGWNIYDERIIMLYHGEYLRAAFSGSATIKKIGRLNFTYLFICKAIFYYYCHNKI